jgi:nucleoside-diphosphate-sugar epimerase
MANVLITGATGFIGRHLTKMLITKGHAVTVLTRDKNSNVELVGASALVGDITDIKTFQKLPSFDWAFHIAGSMDQTKDLMCCIKQM